MHSILLLGGSYRACPPENVWKLAIIRLNLKLILAKNAGKTRQRSVYTIELVSETSGTNAKAYTIAIGPVVYVQLKLQ